MGETYTVARVDNAQQPRRERPGVKESLAQGSSRAIAALEQLAGGVNTAGMALFAGFLVVVTAVLCLVGIGFFIVPGVLQFVHSVAARERSRLSRWGDPVLGPAEKVVNPWADLRDPTTRRELAWLPVHGIRKHAGGT